MISNETEAHTEPRFGKLVFEQQEKEDKDVKHN
jgi:hypothetical protein